MCVCERIYVNVCMVLESAHEWACTYVSVHTNAMHTSTCICLCKCTYVSATHISVCLWESMCASVCISMNACVWVYRCVHLCCMHVYACVYCFWVCMATSVYVWVWGVENKALGSTVSGSQARENKSLYQELYTRAVIALFFTDGATKAQCQSCVPSA